MFGLRPSGLPEQPQVDAAKIGIYGGSYGGYLTALALARDSKLFAAGVDIHGVHDWSQQRYGGSQTDRFEKIPDADKAAKWSGNRRRFRRSAAGHRPC